MLRRAIAFFSFTISQIMNQNNLVHFVGKVKFYSKPKPTTLVVKPHTLTIYLGFGEYRLSSNQVVAFVPSSDSGEQFIAIQHTSPRCPGQIKFSCKTSPSSTLEQIHRVGFTPSGDPSDIDPREQNPIRWYVPFLFILFPILFIYISFFNSIFESSILGITKESEIPMLMFSIGFSINLIVLFSIQFSPILQGLILKSKRSFHEASDELNSMAMISLAILILVHTTALEHIFYTIVSVTTFVTVLGIQIFGHRIRALWGDGV